MAEVNRQDTQRWQFALLLLLLVPVFGGLFLLLPRSVNPSRAEQQGSTLGRQLLQTASAASGDVHAFPKNYKVVGSVDDRYTMAVDPETGQTMLHDAVGGVGTNSTSVEGDRLRLAREMISLDQYASEHQGALNPEDYHWLKNMARTGMQLAFGVPGLSASAQVPVKQSLLDEFHAISANPAGSLLSLKGSAPLDSAVQTTFPSGFYDTSTGSKSSLNLTTSATAPLASTEPSLAVSSTLGLSATLDLNVSGISADTTLSLQPIPIATDSSSTSTNTTPLATSGSPAVTSLSTAVSTTTSSVSPPLTTTVQDYYNALLAPAK